MKLRLPYEFKEKVGEIKNRRQYLMEELVSSISHSRDIINDLQKMAMEEARKQHIPIPVDEPLLMATDISIGSPSFFMCITGTEDDEYLHYENAHFLTWVNFDYAKSGIKGLDKLYERLFPRGLNEADTNTIVDDIFDKDLKLISYVWSHGPLEGKDIGNGEEISYRCYKRMMGRNSEPKGGLFSGLLSSLLKVPERETQSKNCALLNYWETNDTFTARDIARKPVAIEWYGEK